MPACDRPIACSFSFRNTVKYTLSDPIDKDEERRWREWVDQRFVKLVTANIYRSWREAWQTFGYITTEGEEVVRVGACRVGLLAAAVGMLR